MTVAKDCCVAGAAVIDFAALSATATQSGEWFTRYSGCKAGNVTMSGFTEAMRPELYKRSLQLVGLNASGTQREEFRLVQATN